MNRILILLASLLVTSYAYGGNALENDCRSTFDNAHRWNFGQPKDRYWVAKCWDFVEKKDGEWEWVGDAETRRIAEAKRQQEEEEKRRTADEVRQKFDEVMRLWEEQIAAVDAKFETANIKRRWLTENFEEIGLEELEVSIRDVKQDAMRLKVEKARLEQQAEELTQQERNWSESLKLSIWQELKQTKSAKLHTGQGSKRVWCFYFRLKDDSFLLETAAANCRGGRGLGFLEEDDAIEALVELKKGLALLKKRLDVVTEDQFVVPKGLTDIDWRSIANFYLSKLFESEMAADRNQSNPLEVLSKSVQQVVDLGFETTEITSAPPEFVFLVDESESASNQAIGENGLYAHVTFQTQTGEHFLASLEANTETAPIALYLIEEEPNREVLGRETVESEYQSGERVVPNDEYLRLQRELEDLERRYHNGGRNRYAHCTNVFTQQKCFDEAFQIVEKIIFKKSDVRKRLDNTPSSILQPLYSQYAFTKTAIKIEKTNALVALLVNNHEDRIEAYSYPLSEQRAFTVLHGLTEQDKNYKSHFKESVTDEQISAWERMPVKFDLFSLTESKNFDFEDLGTREEFLASLVEDEVAEADEPEAAPSEPVESSDTRFDSVVIVLHPNGGIGTGFYVDEETILTNYHVVEGSQFHEIGLYDGSDTFGKVSATNIALDLALIKVQKRGIPVKFYPSNQLPVGATVDAIGHPQGLEYSLTRGTISGIRRMPSLYDPGGKPVRFIQSDVAINPGNSGGPLFIGDEVVGVNDWKLADTDLEGLSFSIHISEVKKFLTKHGF